MITSRLPILMEKTKISRKLYPKPVICSVSMLRLFKLLKIMSPNDTLTIYIEEDSSLILKFTLKPEKRSKT